MLILFYKQKYIYMNICFIHTHIHTQSVNIYFISPLFSMSECLLLHWTESFYRLGIICYLSLCPMHVTMLGI